MPSEEGPNVSGVPDLRVETTGGEVFIVGEVKGELLTKRTKEVSECPTRHRQLELWDSDWTLVR